MKKSHLEMHQIILHVSFTITIGQLCQRIETTFSSSLMADCTASASTVQLTNYIFCCVHDNLSLYTGIIIWEDHRAYFAQFPAKGTHHTELARVYFWRVGVAEEKMD